MNHRPNTFPAARSIVDLRSAVRPYYTEKRYIHALGVEKEAAFLGNLLLPDRVSELQAAALLHDITKKYDLEKQLKCCAEFGIIMKTPSSPEVIHAVTGAHVARTDFADYVNEDIFGAIRYHTTGHGGMTVFESILFIADYIEPGRTHEVCITLRELLHARLTEADDAGERETALSEAVLMALNNTISYLQEKQAIIDTDTVDARNCMLAAMKMR